jgi:hypothetical protein
VILEVSNSSVFEKYISILGSWESKLVTDFMELSIKEMPDSSRF